MNNDKAATVHPRWRTSTRSSGNGECVEVAALTATVDVRDSKAPDAGHLTLSPNTWADFTAKATTVHATWRKSTHSNGAGGNCVEVTELVTNIGVRDSKAPDAGHLSFTPDLWATFVTDARNGRYDLP